jgi:hypothetical protein
MVFINSSGGQRPSNNRVLETNAVRVLSDINTPDAVKELKKVATKSGPAADQARLSLERLTFRER